MKEKKVKQNNIGKYFNTTIKKVPGAEGVSIMIRAN